MDCSPCIRRGLFLSILGIALLAGIACAPAAAPAPAPPPAAPGKVAGAPEELKIGVVAFLSGPASSPFGIPAKNAAEVWIDKINREGGIGGVKITPVFTDEAGGPEKQVAELRRLFLDEGVDLVIGYISSANCLAVAPVAEELKRLTVLADCGTVRVFEEKQYKYVFRTHAHTVIDGIGAARYALALKPDLKTVAGINQDYAWGRDSWEIFIRTLKQLKPDVQVVETLWPKLFAGEYSAEITALLRTRPDVIFTSFWGGDLITFTKQAEARGLLEESLVVVNNTGAHIKDLPEALAIGSRGPHGIVGPELEGNPQRQEFLRLYEQRFGLTPSRFLPHGAYHYIQALQGVRTAYEKAIEKAGRWPTLDQVIEAFEYLEFDSPSGRIKMAIGGGHQAIEPAGYGIITFDPALNDKTFKEVRLFPAECVNPPDGVASLEWIDQGFPGAKCP